MDIKGTYVIFAMNLSFRTKNKNIKSQVIITMSALANEYRLK